MIAEIAAVVGLATGIAGWVFAYRARGATVDATTKANTEAERARLAEARSGALERERDLAMANEQTARGEFKSAEAAFQMLRSERDRILKANSDLLRKLADAGVAVGSGVLDDAFDRLYANKDRRESRTGEGRGTPDPGTGSSLPAADPDPAGRAPEEE